MSKNKKMVIYILSDSIGETAQYVARAAANQFPEFDFTYRHIPFVADTHYIAEALDKIDVENSVLMYTLVVEELRTYVKQYCLEKQLLHLDILEQPFDILRSITQCEPIGKPGVVQKMDESYFKKIAAIEFAIKYDDGKDVTGLAMADLVLIGVSRTSKNTFVNVFGLQRNQSSKCTTGA